MFALRSRFRPISNTIFRPFSTGNSNNSSWKPILTTMYGGAVFGTFVTKTVLDAQECQKDLKPLLNSIDQEMSVQRMIYNNKWFPNFVESLFFPAFVFGQEVIVRGTVYYHKATYNQPILANDEDDKNDTQGCPYIELEDEDKEKGEKEEN